MVEHGRPSEVLLRRMQRRWKVTAETVGTWENGREQHVSGHGDAHDQAHPPTLQRRPKCQDVESQIPPGEERRKGRTIFNIQLPEFKP